MAARATLSATARHMVDRRVWLVPLGIYLLARSASAFLVTWLGNEQLPPDDPAAYVAATGSATTRAAYLDLLGNWDGQYYLDIAANGYPGALPRVDGAVIENVWAFYPLFPGAVGLLGRTGIPLPLAATLVATACGAAAMVLLFTMLSPTAGRFSAALTVTACSFAPTSLLLQSAYTESMALMEVVGLFLAMRHRRYGWAAVALAALAFTRPIALPVAAVLGVTWLVRRRAEQPFPRREMLAHGGLALGACLSFGAWPLVCGLVTGEVDAYARTQEAWLEQGEVWVTWLSPVVDGRQATLLVLSVPVVLYLVWLCLRRPSRVWGPELRAWVLLYPLYILAVSRPTTAVFRHLSLTTATAWPLPDVSSRARTARARLGLAAVVVCFGLALQYVFIDLLWVTTPDVVPGAP